MYVYIDIYIYMYVYIYICMYILIYIYIYDMYLYLYLLWDIGSQYVCVSVPRAKQSYVPFSFSNHGPNQTSDHFFPVRRQCSGCQHLLGSKSLAVQWCCQSLLTSTNLGFGFCQKSSMKLSFKRTEANCLQELAG